MLVHHERSTTMIVVTIQTDILLWMLLEMMIEIEMRDAKAVELLELR